MHSPADAVARFDQQHRGILELVAATDLHVAQHAQGLHLELGLALGQWNRVSFEILVAIDNLRHLAARAHGRIRILCVHRCGHLAGLLGECLAHGTAIGRQLGCRFFPIGAQLALAVADALGKKILDQRFAAGGSQPGDFSRRIGNADQLVVIADPGVGHFHLARAGAVLRLHLDPDGALDFWRLGIHLRSLLLQAGDQFLVCGGGAGAAHGFAGTFAHRVEIEEVESYNLEIASSPVFGNTIVYTLKGIKGSTFKPNFFFEENKLYYWRIIPVNRCGDGGPTTPAAFHTINKACIETDYIGNVISLKSNRTGSMMLTIPDAGFISDVNVKNFEATAVGINSVSLTLVSPLGTKVKLFDKNCGVTSNFDCSFDDDASVTLLAGGCPPIQGKLIQPLESLSKFIGENKKGDWRIELATDNFLSGFAEFNNFKLDICSDLIVNNPFNLNNLGLYLNAGETKGIGLDLLQSQDIDNTADQLVYTIVAKTQRGDLLLNGQPLDYGSRFTQKDIDDGKLSYHHKGADMEIDGFLFTVEDGAGGWYGTDYFKIQIGAVATDDKTLDPGLLVYPNPTQGQLQISTNEILDKTARLRLINLQGQVILNRSMANSKAEQISIQNFTDGIYILEIKSDKYFATKKVVLKK